jgi:hypothetical protein
VADEYRKPASDKLDYVMEWVKWLDGDTIVDSDWAVSPSGLTISSLPAHSILPSLAHTKVWLEGGSTGTSYTVKNTITTAAGRIRTRAIRVLVQENYNNM